MSTSCTTLAAQFGLEFSQTPVNFPLGEFAPTTNTSNYRQGWQAQYALGPPHQLNSSIAANPCQVRYTAVTFNPILTSVAFITSVTIVNPLQPLHPLYPARANPFRYVPGPDCVPSRLSRILPMRW